MVSILFKNFLTFYDSFLYSPTLKAFKMAPCKKNQKVIFGNIKIDQIVKIWKVILIWLFYTIWGAISCRILEPLVVLMVRMTSQHYRSILAYHFHLMVETLFQADPCSHVELSTSTKVKGNISSDTLNPLVSTSLSFCSFLENKVLDLLRSLSEFATDLHEEWWNGQFHVGYKL